MMGRNSVKFLGRCAAVLLAVAIMPPAGAQENVAPKSNVQAKAPLEKKPLTEKSGELSPKSVRLITGLALTTIPSEAPRPDGSILKIDKEDLANLLIPYEDASRVIRVAYLSAQAQLCEMPELQTENFLTLLGQERAKKKWTEQQMFFINRLHLFTVFWLTGNVTIEEKDGKEEAKIAADPKKKAPKECTSEEKEKLRANIEAFWNKAENRG
jgi:hypothetical protein